MIVVVITSIVVVVGVFGKLALNGRLASPDEMGGLFAFLGSCITGAQSVRRGTIRESNMGV